METGYSNMKRLERVGGWDGGGEGINKTRLGQIVNEVSTLLKFSLLSIFGV